LKFVGGLWALCATGLGGLWALDYAWQRALEWALEWAWQIFLGQSIGIDESICRSHSFGRFVGIKVGVALY